MIINVDDDILFIWRSP